MRPKAATIGMFDGVHLGHRLIMDELKKIAGRNDCDTAVFTFRNHPLSIVKPEIAPLLLTPDDEKRSLLETCGIDNDNIVISPFDNEMRNMTASEFLQNLRDNYSVATLIMGFNNRFGCDTSMTFNDYRELGETLGIRIIGAPELRHNGHEVNSTSIRNALLSGNVTLANEMLGRPYTVTGTVVQGNQLGRTIGFPTANLQPLSQSKLIPKPGVYAGIATLHYGENFPTMINIGTRPTVDDNDTRISIEAHVIGLNSDLYGSVMTLSFIKFMRQECRFNSLDSLRRQLNIDRIEAESIINPILKTHSHADNR